MTLNQGPGRGGRLFRVAVCAGIAAVLAACGSSPRAPVENRSTGGISIPRVDPATLPGYEWVNDWMDLFAKFPGVKNDDDVDAWTQALNWRRTRAGYKAESPKPAVGGGRTF